MRKKSPEEPRKSALASGWTVEGAPEPVIDASVDPNPAAATDAAQEPAGEAEDGAQSGPQLSNAALVLLGVFAGLFLLYSWIWMSWAQYYAPVNANLAEAAGAVGGAAQQIVYWLAPAAPLLWFAATLFMNWGRMRRLVLWLAIGAVVLLPLPVFSGGAA